MKKFWMLLAALALLAPATGCVSGAAFNQEEICASADASKDCGLTAETAFFAAVSDYVRAKSAAANYAESPTTPLSHSREILKVVEAADAEIAAVVKDWRTSSATDDDYVKVSNFLRTSVIRMNARIAQGELTK